MHAASMHTHLATRPFDLHADTPCYAVTKGGYGAGFLSVRVCSYLRVCSPCTHSAPPLHRHRTLRPIHLPCVRAGGGGNDLIVGGDIVNRFFSGAHERAHVLQKPFVLHADTPRPTFHAQPSYILLHAQSSYILRSVRLLFMHKLPDTNTVSARFVPYTYDSLTPFPHAHSSATPHCCTNTAVTPIYRLLYCVYWGVAWNNRCVCCTTRCLLPYPSGRYPLLAALPKWCVPRCCVG